ncbi:MULTISPECIES: gp16 family protein [Chromobacterium]|uniref:Mu-like prophage protein gp16 n=2 Tax=Chromobacterium TaxID=535 RepID=A0AAX2M4M7_CHRVL|nr:MULTISPECIES: regulatory protein GemA [Chromobacterium]AXE33101.1 regulatory protein GemA [Chromobacterium phragmitis]MCD0491386.1 regulatory protein GemA [Chromobacterium violaceum]OLZ77075.1 GemA protein [Chromobacterium violaceum]STB70905.1 Mu-like prophage protein gp16 [Chromobacterium violaceum]STB71623.1 Mu-like prophage protein gp16 [Chromobacterium violaceum]
MRNPALAKIHIAKKELGLDDDTYRAMLLSVGGAASSKDLSPAGVDRVLAHMKRCGWKPKSKAADKPSVGQSKKRLVSKLEALLAEADRPWDYADAMAQRMYGVERAGWLAPVQLHGLVAALTYDAKRHGRFQG